jgi:hypothetical protein
VEWSGTDDLLRVHLLNGVVTVGGPQTRGGVTLLPGQVLEARPDEGILRIEPAPAAPAAPAAPGTPGTPGTPSTAGRATEAISPVAPSASSSPAAPPTLSGVPTASGEVGASPGPAAEPGTRPVAERGTRPTAVRARAVALVGPPRANGDFGSGWRKQIARGAFAEILREAEARGTESCLRSLPSERLAALGDAARYSGRTDLARRVLNAQRERFAGSAAASEATFLLGRLAEDAHEPGSAALPWYERYLAQTPGGVYAAEALGREMLILGERDNDLRAREVARKYLESYPHGAYVAQARQILEDAP